MPQSVKAGVLREMIKRYFMWSVRPVAVGLALLCSAIDGRATVYAIVLDNRVIAIASDSRKVLIDGNRITTADSVEKVIPLGTKLAFMSSGVMEISGAASAIQLSELVRMCYSRLSKGSRRVSIKELATVFATLTTNHLNRLTDSEKATVVSLAQRFGSQNSQVTESILAGLDRDGILKVETIDFYMSSLTAAGNGGLRFDWSVVEAVAKPNPRVILSGEVTVLKSAFQADASPIRRIPSFEPWARAMEDGKQVNEEQTAEALVDLTIKYAPPDGGRLGYPIFVYKLDVKNGFRRLRTVPSGKAVDLPH